MPSIIPGYEYDIFISYRQKDNKGDHWVSEFVENLKIELESTFKEEISVYFDINPHDGLLETYDVESSLKDKLKCLVFIPIISRTYCDPGSYAWANEFTAFVELASRDQFGLKVKLPNGNVANRMIPVQIHDLYQEDKSLIEKTIGGVLRSIEFIYKEPGVNKPLTADDDDKKNLNNTKYRIQINKVANAIDEIFHGLKEKQPALIDNKESPGQPIHTTEEDNGKEATKPKLIDRISRKWLMAGLLTIFLITGAFVVFMVIESASKNNDIARLEKSIAVLPFVSDSPDQANTYFINGLMEEVLNNLQKIKDFRVLSRTSTEQYRGSALPTLPEIAKNLDVNYIVEGSGQKYGNKFRLRVQLIAAKNEKHLWGESYEKEITGTNDIFKVQSEIAQSIAAELKATITPEEKQLIEKEPTTNLTAYDFYQRGREEYLKYSMDMLNLEAVQKAEPLFRKALAYDSAFALAYAGLADIYWKKYDMLDINSNKDILNKYLDSMRIFTDIALSHDDRLVEAYDVMGGYYAIRGNSVRALEEWDKAIKYNPNHWIAYWNKGWYYGYHLFDMVKSIQNYQKAGTLNHGTGLDEILNRIGDIYYMSGFPEKGNDLFLEALRLSGDSGRYHQNIVYNSAEITGDYREAIELCKKRYAADTNNVGLLNFLGYFYVFEDSTKEALYYYKKLISRLNKNAISDYGAPLYIGYAFQQNGYSREAEFYFNKQLEISGKNTKPEPWIILAKAYSLAGVYALTGEKKKAIDNLKEFTKTRFCPLWRIVYIKNDPIFNNIRSEVEFKEIVKDLESKFQKEHERVGQMMNLLPQI